LYVHELAGQPDKQIHINAQIFIMQLSIIIVNFRSSRLIANCLQSIYAQSSSISFEVFVMDNDSKDDSYEYLNTRFPMVSWHQMGYNAGFARANNAGIRVSHGEVVLLLNPDTVIPKNALDSCFQQFIQSEYVACGVQLLNEDSSPQISGNYFVKGGLNYLLPLPFTGKLIKALGKLFAVKPPHVANAGGLTEVDWINGAFLMVKQSAILKAGLMDEDFFLYAEEAEWCSRLKKVGKLCIFGNVKVYHLQGISANETFSSVGKGYYNLFDKKGKQIMLSNLVRIRKQYGPIWFLFILLMYSLTVPVFYFGLLFSRLLPKSSRIYQFADFNGFCKNLVYVWSLTAKILSNRPYFYKVL
jgi:GT2 family glycosyltransferase